jgi:hypothetical protein
MPTISQIMSASYPAVIAERPANQWAESALMRALESGGFIKRFAMGDTIEANLDYRANTGAQMLATDLTPTSTTKTEVLTAASYSPAALSVPVVWSKQDEAKNEDQKVDLVAGLIDNALESHDDLIEQNLFVGTNGFIGFNTLITVDGTGTIGGIVAGTDVFWKNKFGVSYVNAAGIEAQMTSVWNKCTKGTGSPMTPKVLVSDAATQALFEGSQQTNQRFVNSSELNAGFLTLAFKSSKYVFSPYGTSSIYFLNPKNYQLRVSKSMYRFKEKETPLEAAEGYKTSVFSVLQAITDNRSRLGVAFV